MVGKSPLPYLTPESQVKSRPPRIATLDELKGTLQRDIYWRKDEMEMFGHQNEVVQQVAALGRIVFENVEE